MQIVFVSMKSLSILEMSINLASKILFLSEWNPASPQIKKIAEIETVMNLFDRILIFSPAHLLTNSFFQ